jgi:hypothetical protein
LGFSLLASAPAGIAEGSTSAHNARGGSVVLAMAAGEAFGGDGDVATVTFGTLSPYAGINSVALTEAAFNDGEPPVEIGIAAARGVYFFCMEAEGYRATEKIVFMKQSLPRSNRAEHNRGDAERASPLRYVT